MALDCVEIDELAPVAEVVAAQDLADRISAMLSKLIQSAEWTLGQPVVREPWSVNRRPYA